MDDDLKFVEALFNEKKEGEGIDWEKAKERVLIGNFRSNKP